MAIHSRRIFIYARLGLGLALISAGIVGFWHGDKSLLGIPLPVRHATSSAGLHGFDKTQYSHDAPTSLWVVVNKRRPLKPIDYAPQLVIPDVALRLPGSDPEMQVSSQVAPALQQLFGAAKKSGLQLMVASGYRSYQAQVNVYNAEVNANGTDSADQVSARPGYSEHQTGLAVDVEPTSRQCEVETCFAALPEGKWLAANAHNYGFVIRYSKASEPVAGYSYEPWHIRYVGTALSNQLYANGNPPLETFFGLGAAPSYQ